MSEIVGEVGTKKLFENERVIVWEMRLEPGEKELVHQHQHDYLMIQITGDRVAADFEPGSQGTWSDFAGQRLEGDVSNGNVLFAEKGGIEAAVNVGNETFYEIIGELKDSAVP
jgi:beta-alanine degradation protein BauB